MFYSFFHILIQCVYILLYKMFCTRIIFFIYTASTWNSHVIFHYMFSVDYFLLIKHWLDIIYRETCFKLQTVVTKYFCLSFCAVNVKFYFENEPKYQLCHIWCFLVNTPDRIYHGYLRRLVRLIKREWWRHL